MTPGGCGAGEAPPEHARRLFLDPRHVHGCAEATFVALKTAYGLPDPEDASAAMALNGGVAYEGEVCGAISGAALAVGVLATLRIADHRTAKWAAREIVAGVMDDFRTAYGAVGCRQLIGIDLREPGGHRAFIESGIWEDRCVSQIVFVVRRLALLVDEATWDRAVARLGAAAALEGTDPR